MMNIFPVPFSAYASVFLSVFRIPGWVNRFAHAGDTAAEIAGNTAYRLRQAKTEIVSASKVAYRFLAGVASNNSNTATAGDSNSASPGFQASWLKNFVSPGAKPSSSSSELESLDQDVISQKQRRDAKALGSNSEHI